MNGHLAQGQSPVSVVIPCYRCTGTIDRALESIVAQTLLPAEVIVVDDGSGDGTLDHLRALSAKHGLDWIQVIALRENQGAASARNAGWELATQRYVAFLDADDAWHPQKIEMQYGVMSMRPEVAMSGHGHETLRSSGVPRSDVPEPTVSMVSKFSMLVSNRFITPSVMLKRDLPYRFLPGRRHIDDHLLWLQILCGGYAAVLISAKLAFTFKPLYGQSGLSAELWKMEQAELENYRILRREGCIGVIAALGLQMYSLVKFIRRVLLVGIGRLTR